jgi:hypothetical protein
MAGRGPNIGHNTATKVLADAAEQNSEQHNARARDTLFIITSVLSGILRHLG